ncbi:MULTISPECIES: carotenoid biosynthesis protein [Solibacillus]|uniref:Carotenoid biosynthesis protein n=1 Tax=Solibacillus merdavium TaxID=2762218 RepID=A0ABR8XJS2_9BACL|nr:carotenoid biosynthesis protein [Solibacillus merdavium]MBD8032158.1 carotenoid biosynthesis protein [Solibacillus merdavium]
MRIADYIFYFFLFWYICGVVLVGFDLLPSWLEWSNSIFIITSGILGGIYFLIHFRFKLGFLIFVGIFVSTFIIEYYGSSSQFLFGDYTYSNYFAPNVMGVPVAIGFAWVMVIATGHAIIMKFGVQNIILRALLGGVLALTMDLILDPVAYKAKQYWIWHEPGIYYDIPWTNFFGWFIVAFCIHIILSFISVSQVNKVWQDRLVLLYILIIIMFALIGLMNGIYLASTIVVTALLFLIFSLRKEGQYASS